MATQGRSGRGTKVYISDMASNEAYTLIEDCRALDWADGYELLDSQHFDSQGKEFCPDIDKNSPWSLQVNWNPESTTGQKMLNDARIAKKLTNFVVGVPKKTGTSYYYIKIPAYVQDSSGSLAVGAIVGATHVLQPSGGITWGHTFTPPA